MPATGSNEARAVCLQQIRRLDREASLLERTYDAIQELRDASDSYNEYLAFTRRMDALNARLIEMDEITATLLRTARSLRAV